jgi:hypothetical protein
VRPFTAPERFLRSTTATRRRREVFFSSPTTSPVFREEGASSSTFHCACSVELTQFLSSLPSSSGVFPPCSWFVTSVALNDMEEIYPMVTGINSSRTGGWIVSRTLPSFLLFFH